jgi:hypothetical protein
MAAKASAGVMENPGLVAFIAALRGNQIAIALQTLLYSWVSAFVCSQHCSQKSGRDLFRQVSWIRPWVIPVAADPL